MIFYCILYGWENIIEFLIEYEKSKININEKEISGNNSIHIASMCGFETIIKKLKTTGININEKNKKDQLPKDVAITDKISNLLSQNES